MRLLPQKLYKWEDVYHWPLVMPSGLRSALYLRGALHHPHFRLMACIGIRSTLYLNCIKPDDELMKHGFTITLTIVTLRGKNILNEYLRNTRASTPNTMVLQNERHPNLPLTSYGLHCIVISLLLWEE